MKESFAGTWGQLYLIAQNRDSYCCHLDSTTPACAIWEYRPASCRIFDCRKGKHIYLDFENMIINSDINRADWPLCVSRKEGQETKP